MKRFLLHPAFLVVFVAAVGTFGIPGCSFMPFKGEAPPGETTPFQSNITAEPVPVAAEIVTDLTGIPQQVEARPVRRKATGAQVNAAPILAKNEEPGAAPGPNSKKFNTNYTVKSGDTLMKISFAAFGNVYRWREIYQTNKSKIPNPNALIKGTVLHITGTGVTITKNGNPYLIQKRDTLIKISDGVYGTPSRWKNIWHNNPELIHDPNKIYAGFNLYYTMSELERKAAEHLKSQKIPAPTLAPASERKPAAVDH